MKEKDSQRERDDKREESYKPATKGKRFLKLAGMTAYVVGSYAKQKITSIFQDEKKAEESRRKSYTQVGEKIADTLGQLKGAVMKVGQMASLANDLLPKEVVEKLTSLQREAPPMPFSVIAEQIERELGKPHTELFAEFDTEPMAAASIGQVYRATLHDGREVVVKVQYPGVEEACDSDLNHLKLTLKASGLLKFDKRSIDELFEEIRARLREELDYSREAAHVRLFRNFHKRHPFFVIPEVIEELSTKKILTLTLERGDHIDTLEEKGYSREIRDKIGYHISEMVCSQIFELGAVHADPNHANFAFRPDGKIVIYDFGCVKFLSHDFLERYRTTIRAALEEDYETFDKGLISLGARKADGPPIEPEYYREWRAIIMRPFLQFFDYGTSTIHEEVIKRIPGLLKRISSFQPSAELFFIDRMIVGHYETMRKLKARGYYGDMLRDYLNRKPLSKEEVEKMMAPPNSDSTNGAKGPEAEEKSEKTEEN